jgi:hypothetical protein
MRDQRTRGQSYVMTRMREKRRPDGTPFYYAGFLFVRRIPLIRHSGVSTFGYKFILGQVALHPTTSPFHNRNNLSQQPNKSKEIEERHGACPRDTCKSRFVSIQVLKLYITYPTDNIKCVFPVIFICRPG